MYVSDRRLVKAVALMQVRCSAGLAPGQALAGPVRPFVHTADAVAAACKPAGGILAERYLQQGLITSHAPSTGYQHQSLASPDAGAHTGWLCTQDRLLTTTRCTGTIHTCAIPTC